MAQGFLWVALILAIMASGGPFIRNEPGYYGYYGGFLALTFAFFIGSLIAGGR